MDKKDEKREGQIDKQQEEKQKELKRIQEYELKQQTSWKDTKEFVFGPNDCCMQCESKEQLLKLFSDQEFICQKCYSIQANWFTEFKNGKAVYYPDYNLIVENLYLGNEDTAMDAEIIEKTGIMAICATGAFLMTPFEGRLQYKKYNIADFPSENILKYFDENYQWIEEMIQKKKTVLVHCAAGVSRSSSFVIAYLMKKKKIGYEEARKLVKEKRNIVNPNSGFVNQLREYEKQLFGEQKLEE